ncbi:MAG: hypothetical protein HY962_04385 [Ignavibacteriae bacterium]|nr:hypothetical protein [Ignavibacteriota bacterium]
MVVFLNLLLALPTAAQPCTSCPDSLAFYDKVVRLKDGGVIKNTEVGYERVEGQYERYFIKTRDGELIRRLPADILVIESHARTFLPPLYQPVRAVYPCDDRQRERQWYFVELRGWMLLTGEDTSRNIIGLEPTTFGPEAVFGLRFGRWGVGIGGGWFRARDINRFPLFLHGRYQLSLDCFSPFLYVQAGTVFDDQSGEMLALNTLFHPAPKLAGLGIGVDWAVASWLDISADVGYRYMQLPTEVPCDCSNAPDQRVSVYHNESHGLLVRLGVTF